MKSNEENKVNVIISKARYEELLKLEETLEQKLKEFKKSAEFSLVTYRNYFGHEENLYTNSKIINDLCSEKQKLTKENEDLEAKLKEFTRPKRPTFWDNFF